LPTIMLSFDGHDMNELCGYTEEMDVGHMRENILPVDDGRKISFTLDTVGSKVGDIEFEIRSLDNSRQIESMEIEDFTQNGNKISAELPVMNLVNNDEEYLLIFHINVNGKPVHYYTRIVCSPKSAVDECIDFAMDFHNATMDPAMVEELKTFMETDRSRDNNSLQDVTIKSSLKQLSWGDLNFVQDGDIYMEVSEVSTTACEITFYYDIVRQGEESIETTEVTEFYRVRKGEDRVYLLDFERTLSERFTMSGFQGADNVIKLGIVNPEVNYKYNDIGTICAFEQAGDLYIYSEDDNTITKVFSFKGTSDRASYKNHKIKVLTIDGTGMMDFLVYGYMAAGDREGQVGISLYHYDETSEEIEERIHIESDRCASVLSADLGELFYENTDDEIFILIDGVLEKININTGETEEILTDLNSSRYSVSESGRFISYIDNDDYNVIHVLDLNTENCEDITSPSGSVLIPLLYMQEDFVYGVAEANDLAMYEGDGIPMYSVKIVDSQNPNNAVLKNYDKPGYYVTNVTEDGYTLYLDRIRMYEDGQYQEEKQDTIMNSQGEDMDKVRIELAQDEIKQMVVSLILQSREEERPKIRRTVSSIVDSKPTEIKVKSDNFQSYYYTYRGSKAILASSDPVVAIKKAYEKMGQVVDGSGQTIWKRGRAAYKNNIYVKIGSSDIDSGNAAKCISAILDLEGENIQVESLLERGKTPYDILASTLKDKKVLDLTGANSEQVMYYISKGTPVYTMLGKENPVLLIGYDNFNFSYFDPATSSVKKIGQEDAAKLCEQGQNKFVVYLR